MDSAHGRSLKGTLLRSGITMLVMLGMAGNTLAAPPTDLSKVVGVWNNVNSATRGFVRIDVTNVGGLGVRAFGSCTPTPCDLGTVPGNPHSLNVVSNVAEGWKVVYNFGFATIALSAQRTYDINGGEMLRVTQHTVFAPGDTRKDYMSTEVYRR